MPRPFAHTVHPAGRASGNIGAPMSSLVGERIFRARTRGLRLLGLVFAIFTLLVAELSAEKIRGLPFSRSYSLEDIGYVPRGSRLTFDQHGRVAIVHDGIYAVLNDTTWLNLADTSEASRVAIADVVEGRDGHIYYGGLASWGEVAIQADGKLHSLPLVPKDRPDWTQTTSFEEVFVTEDGVYFASRAGVVFLEPATRHLEFYAIPKASKTFSVGNKIFVSSFERPLQHVDVANRRLQEVGPTPFDGGVDHVIEHATKLDGSRALVCTLEGKLYTFDGRETNPWAGQASADLTGPVSALQRLADGNIAISTTGKGIFVLTPRGDLVCSLTIPEYHRISNIASREAGVLWVINENSVEKILYGSGLTSFGQRLGLPLDWPLVAEWGNRTYVASLGILYEDTTSPTDTTTRFRALPQQPPNGAWSVAAWGPHLLVGNATGVYSVQPDLQYTQVAALKDTSHLVMAEEGLCYVIGPSEIALLKWDGKEWVEPVPRIPGIRNPAVAHAAGHSAWIETAGSGVSRIWVRDGALHHLNVPSANWTKSHWINVGVIGDIVVLSGNRNERRFFSEKTESWVEQPALYQLLDRAPEWLARVRSSSDGVLWASYNEGIVKFTPRGNDYEMDVSTFDLINDRYPLVRVLPGSDEVWVSASRSLYHVEPAAKKFSPLPAPILVSLVDGKTKEELLTARTKYPAVPQFSFARNSLTFRFFSGGYGWRRTPIYEFRLHPGEPWSTLDTGSLLRFSEMREGVYQLQVRRVGNETTALNFPFEILPPAGRTWLAYSLYAVFTAAVIGFGLRWSNHLARKRNHTLEQLVRERTSQLEATMQKLNEETRISATLAERDRMASDIHDSVQQGLSGAIIQLDTTLTLPALTGTLRSRLKVARNMVSYARQEVEHAVWDMESPLLDGNDLGAALQTLTSFVSAKHTPNVSITGTPVALSRPMTHHLLRIAQEASTNAIRHAQANQLDIRLSYRSDAVLLEIADDGSGFHPETVLNQAGHFGLRGMLARAQKLSGVLQIVSAPGQGTTISVTVPHPPQPPTLA